MNPSQVAPYQFAAPLAAEAPSSETQFAATSVETEALVGEVLAPEQPPVIPTYPIGLIDFNLPIVVVSSDDHDNIFDNAQILTTLKGSLYPVVISFWEHGEQKVSQFDTDGSSTCGEYKVEQEYIYPRTLFIVIGRDGRSLEVDEELYVSEDAARAETNLDDIAGIFPVVIEAKVDPVVIEPVVEAVAEADGEADLEDSGDDQEAFESEEGDDEIEGTEDPAPAVPTEMYVAGRPRRIGETVHAYRQNFGTRICTILKLRNDHRKSLFIDPKDGNEPYWALNKNVRY